MGDHDRIYHSVKTVENFAEIHLEAQRYIESNFENTKLTANDFCKAKGFSLRQVQRALSWHTTSWSRMLLDQRMRRAKELLRYSGEPMETITERAGYDSLAQFNRTFKAEEGIEPEEYRNG